jgi:S1-C subfamily serine protease
MSWIVMALALAAQDAVYEKAAPSVVGVRVRAPALGERSGTGVILSKDGLILTSSAVCPEGSTNIRVWIRGPRRYTAKIVATSPRDEVTLLRIEPRHELHPIELGQSSALKPGQRAYTLGNAVNSIILDDQPSFNAGIISGLYRLPERRANAAYTGWVIETTAAVNAGMAGAPCLDAKGRMVGMVTLNFSPHRFLGAAIPVDFLKPVLERLKKKARPSGDDPPPAAAKGTLGLELKDENNRAVVAKVAENGPADRAGLRPGDVILEVGREPVKSARDVAARLEGLEAGSVVWLKVEVGGAAEQIRITLGAK